jgi:tyrosine-protein phosphatase YwqE
VKLFLKAFALAPITDNSKHFLYLCAMLSLFKSKPTLKDLIPDNYVDIHSHLLPGIDDGAKTFEDSLRLTKALQEFGTSQIITTPHIIRHFWENTSEIIKSKHEITGAELSKNKVSMPFRAAAEYMMDEHFVQLFQSKDILTLKDNYVLVEMSYLNPPIQLYSILFDLQVAGYIPVLAHPERYVFYHNNFDEYAKLINAGCLLQLNLLSVVGYYGEGITAVAKKLLKKGMYRFVGSDVHHSNHIAAFDQKIKLKDLSPLQEIIANNQFFSIA